jgi:PhzF family phenazine biosynthesis protein
MKLGFQMIDVFGKDEFSGNPVAVIADAEGLDTETMQRVTRWLNLSETTFLLPPTKPGADYRVRIFTLQRELPFAGHPTLGTCHAWLAAGGTPHNAERIVQECEAGLIQVRRDGGLLAFAAPPRIRSGPADPQTVQEAASVLNVPTDEIVEAQWVDNGPGWLGILLKSADAVLALEPKRHHARRIDIGVVGPHQTGSDTDFEVRAIFSDQHGALIEDPVTGSLNASVAQWLIEGGLAHAPYLAAQGTRLGRTGRIAISQSEGEIWVAGKTVTAISGEIEI